MNKDQPPRAQSREKERVEDRWEDANEEHPAKAMSFYLVTHAFI